MRWCLSYISCVTSGAVEAMIHFWVVCILFSCSHWTHPALSQTEACWGLPMSQNFDKAACSVSAHSALSTAYVWLCSIMIIFKTIASLMP